MTRVALLALVVALVGCKGYPNVCDDYSGKTCISLEVHLSDTGPASIDTIRISPLSGFTLTQSNAQLSLPNGTATPLPILVPILPATVTGRSVAVLVQGLLQGNIVGYASFVSPLQIGDHLQATVDLTPGVGVADDMGTGSDAASGPAADMNVSCDPVDQTGCGGGSKCTATAAGSSTQCVANGSAALGASCTTAPDNCVAGDYCVPSLAYCARFCRTNSDCPTGAGPVSSSNISYCGTFSSYYKVGPVSYCTQPCNPVPAIGASICFSNGSIKCDAWSFTVGDMGATEYTDCGPVGTGGDGATCSNSTNCSAGYGCVFVNGAGHCRMYCRANTNGDCLSGMTCVPVGGWSFTGACCPSAGC